MWCLVTLVTTSLFVYNIPADAELSTWLVRLKQNVIDYESLTSSRTEMMCVRKCEKDSHCDSCAYDSDSGLCYLQVQTITVSDNTVSTVTAYTEACRISDAPINTTTTTATWRTTETGVTGDVQCTDNDYMYIGDQPALTCRNVPGRWHPQDGQCRQSIWTTPKAGKFYSVPTAPVAGWAVCLTGTPTNLTRINVNLLTGGHMSYDIIVHMDFRFRYKGSTNCVTLTSKVDNTWMGATCTPLNPFPLVLGQPYLLEIKAVSLTSVEVYVDGSLLNTFTPPTSLHHVTHVHSGGDLNLTFVDLWCHE